MLPKNIKMIMKQLVFIVILLSYSALCADYCSGYDHKTCDLNFACAYEETEHWCHKVIYEQLGDPRDDLPHYVIFDEDETCDYDFSTQNDFAVHTSFFDSRKFRSWCRLMNVHKIRVYQDYYPTKGSFDDEADDVYATNAIIYPKAQEGCALLYSKKYYRGDSWEICFSTRLNGKKVGSIMVGVHAQLSLYDSHGIPLMDFQQATFKIDGLPNLYGHRFEYVKIEKYGNED